MTGPTVSCPRCGASHTTQAWAVARHVCDLCGHHARLDAQGWIHLLADPGSFEPLDRSLRAVDALGFNDGKAYVERLAAAHAKQGPDESLATGWARLDGTAIALGAMDFGFVGGSLGVVAGEKLVRLADRARELRRPLVVVTASGGARMQEGALALMQLATTTAAIARLHDAGCLFIAILADPTTGGVMASFPSLADFILAEPGATLGFAGRRVIEQCTGEAPEEGFQSSEARLASGLVDAVLPRAELKAYVARILRAHGLASLPVAGPPAAASAMTRRAASPESR